MSTLSPPATIPVPLHSGDYTMNGGSYTGDVGSIDPNSPATLRLTNAAVSATVGGFGDPDPSTSTRQH